MAVEPGQRLSHYRLLEKVGEGGMGVVFRALDEHLERDVAVKVLSGRRRLDDDARERFRIEARALSKLNHPNIETAHDFDTEGEVDFLVMELIPGTTLAARVARGPLPETEIVALGRQLAEGLEAAHAQGILHRDLKPNNLRLTPDGRLKILDFGLAKLLRPAAADSDAETALRTRGIVGTAPYMAPEQLRGEEVDERTDLYAAGVVLYEMGTGRPPYREKLETALVEAILHQVPVPPRALNRHLSPDLERIILKCLDKQAANRYQSARELAVDLRRVAAGTEPAARVAAEAVKPEGIGVGRGRRLAAAGMVLVLGLLAFVLVPQLSRLRSRLGGPAPPSRIESLAVLPLDNLMNDPEQQYFVDGMHEALISNLARIGALRVISRTSVMRFRDAERSLPAIARELGVDAIVEGSVLREGQRVRITAQLVDGVTDAHLWTNSYEGDLTRVLEVQGETARAIAREIRVVVTEEEQSRMAAGRSVDREAYEAYLKGRYYLNQRTEDEVFRSLEYFEESVARDPDDVLAQAALAEAAILTGWYRWAPPREAFPRAKRAVDRALALDPESAEAHTVAAAVHMLWDWDLAAAEAEFRRAIELEPNYPRAHHWYALFLNYVGRYEEAIAQIERAQELDPLSLIIHAIAGLAYCNADRHEEAVREAGKTLEMNPDFPFALSVLACGYIGLGRYDEAIAAAQRAIDLTGQATELSTLAQAHFAAGRRDRALELLARVEEQAKSEFVSATTVAALHLLVGQHDEAVDWLEKAYEEHSWSLIYLGSDSWEPLRSDPRFQDLLRRIGLPAG